MKIRYPVLQLVKAHYTNKNLLFDDYVKAIAAIFAEEGDLQAKDELLKMMANHGEIKPLPDDYIGKGSHKYKFKSNESTASSTIAEVKTDKYNDLQNNALYDDKNEQLLSVDDMIAEKSHAENIYKKEDNEDLPGQISLDDYIKDNTGIYTLPKSKENKSTKADMEASRIKE